ncbi:Paraplegin [Dactylella cylindrospora]|nr:Paraplegin [Dactylella cylindrospora]
MPFGIGSSAQNARPSENPPPYSSAHEQEKLGLSADQAALPTEVTQEAPRTLKEQLFGNQFLTAGVGVVGLTAGLAVGRKSLTLLSQAITRHYLVTLEIPIRDQSYPWFLQWIHDHQRKLSQALASPVHSAELPHVSPFTSPIKYIFTRYTPRTHHLSVATTLSRHDNGSISTSFSLLPGIGNHIFRYKNAFIRMSRTRELKNLDPSGTPWETISLTTLYAHRNIFTELLSAAQEHALKSQEGKTVIYTSWMTEWRPFGQPKTKRPLSSVVLDKGVKESIVNDISDFLASAKWYHDRGIPYRRGYLLHGPPGSGKSSFIKALAGELNYDICLINLSERGLTDDRLNHLLSNMPNRSIALLEDVDAAFANRKQKNEEGYSGANVTFSGLLNALDGVASSEERIIFLTTNFKERLDDALIRPGRVDMAVHIGLATEWQVEKMFERFYGSEEGEMEDVEQEERREEVKKLCAEFVSVLKQSGAFEEGGRGVSTAELQGLFVYHKRSPEEVVETVRRMVGQQKK